MTLGQVHGALAAVEREDRQRLRNALIASRGGQAKASDFKQLLKRLDGEE